MSHYVVFASLIGVGFFFLFCYFVCCGTVLFFVCGGFTPFLYRIEIAILVLSFTPKPTQKARKRISPALLGFVLLMGNLACALYVIHSHPASVKGGVTVLPSAHWQLCQRHQDETVNAQVYSNALSNDLKQEQELCNYLKTCFPQRCLSKIWALNSVKFWRKRQYFCCLWCINHCANLWEHSPRKIFTTLYHWR